MSSGTLSSLLSAQGAGNKRLACDRCRGQKLKCTRDEHFTVCQRCISAKAECVFGSPNPPGRPPASPNALGQQQQRRRHQQQQHSPHIPPQPLPTPASTTSPSQLHQTLPNAESSNRFDEAAFFDLFYSPQLASFDPSAVSLATPNNLALDTNWRGRNEEDQTSVPVAGNDTPFSNWDVFMNTKDEPQTALPAGTAAAPNHASPVIPDAATTRCQCIEQLLQLTADMYKLQSRYNGPVVDTHKAFPSEFAGSVMQLATNFLNLANSFANLMPPIARCDSTSNMAMDRDPVASNWTSTSALSSHPSSSASYTPSVLSSASSFYCPTFENDRSVALQLVACYLRMLQLYTVLYSTIYDHVRWSDSEDSAREPIWDGLGIGAAALSSFPELQMRLVVQALAEVLSRVEAKLGLHEHYRSSRRSHDEGTGILSAMDVPPQLIKNFMEESMAGQGQNHNVITRLADLGERLNSLLDTSGRK